MKSLLVGFLCVLLAVCIYVSADDSIPLYVPQQLTTLTKKLILRGGNTTTVNLKQITDMDLYFRDTIGSAMLSPVQSLARYPHSDFFQAKEHAVVMPLAYSPVCLAVNVKNHPVLSQSAAAGDVDLEPASVNQIAAWLMGNETLLNNTATGESPHVLLSVARPVLSLKSALGAVVADALRAAPGNGGVSLSMMFPAEDTVTGSGSKTSIWPEQVTANSKAQWVESDDAVETALRDASPTAGEVAAGFVLYASDLAIARPANGIRCLPILTLNKDGAAVNTAAGPANASAIDATLLDVFFQNSSHDLPVVARRRFAQVSSPSASSATSVPPPAMYPFIAIIALNVDTRTFKCGARAVSIQDLFFNVTFADSISTAVPPSSFSLRNPGAAASSPLLSYEEALTSAGGALQPAWPWVLPDARVRNAVRLQLHLVQKAFVQCPSSTDASIFHRRALGSISVAAASPDTIAALASTAEAFLVDAMAHPLQQQEITKTAANGGGGDDDDNSKRTSNVFFRPSLILFQESYRDGPLDSVFRGAAHSGTWSGDSTGSSVVSVPAADHPVIVAAFGSGFSSGPSFVAPLQAPAAPTTSKAAAESATAVALLTMPLALSSTCLVYNPVAQNGATLPDGLHFPACLLAEVLSSSSSSSSASVHWNDRRLRQRQPHPLLHRAAQFSSTGSESVIQLIVAERDGRFSLSSSSSSEGFERVVVLASNHCTAAASAAATVLTTASTAPAEAKMVSDEKLLDTLVNTPGALSFAPCSRVADLIDAGLLNQGHISDSNLLDSSSSNSNSAAALKSTAATQQRAVMKNEETNSINKAGSSSSSAAFLQSPSLGSFAVGDIVQKHAVGIGSAASLFSTLNVWLSRSAIASTPFVVAGSTAATPDAATTMLHSGQNCTQLFAAARFVEWLLSAGYGIDAGALSAQTFEGLVSSPSAAGPLLTLAQEQYNLALLDPDFLAACLGPTFVESALTSVRCVDAASGAALASYRTVPPEPSAIDPASRLIFAAGFPVILFAMGLLFVGVFYYLRRRETDDTRYAPVDAAKPIAIACAHVPLKEHLRGYVGHDELEEWLELYRGAVRECAEKSKVYVAKEGDNCGFIVAADSADKALEFAFALHEDMVEMVLGKKLSGEDEEDTEAELTKDELALRRALGFDEKAKREEAAAALKEKRRKRAAARGVTEKMKLALEDAYKAMRGPFSRNIAGAAPLRVRTDAYGAERMRRRQSLGAIVESSPMKRTRNKDGGGGSTLEEDKDKMFVVTTGDETDFFGSSPSSEAGVAGVKKRRMGGSAFDGKGNDGSGSPAVSSPSPAAGRLNRRRIINYKQGVSDIFEDEDEAEEYNKLPDEVKAELWAGLLVSVGVDIGRCDVHLGQRGVGGSTTAAGAGSYDYSGVPVEHADSLALIASAGQTLVSEAVLDDMGPVFEMRRVGRITCVGDLDLGIALPIRDMQAEDEEEYGEDGEEQQRKRKLAAEKKKRASGLSEKVLVEDLRAEFRKHNPTLGDGEPPQQQQQQQQRVSPSALHREMPSLHLPAAARRSNSPPPAQQPGGAAATAAGAGYTDRTAPPSLAASANRGAPPPPLDPKAIFQQQQQPTPTAGAAAPSAHGSGSASASANFDSTGGKNSSSSGVFTLSGIERVQSMDVADFGPTDGSGAFGDTGHTGSGFGDTGMGRKRQSVKFVSDSGGILMSPADSDGTKDGDNNDTARRRESTSTAPGNETNSDAEDSAETKKKQAEHGVEDEASSPTSPARRADSLSPGESEKVSRKPSVVDLFVEIPDASTIASPMAGPAQPVAVLTESPRSSSLSTHPLAAGGASADSGSALNSPVLPPPAAAAAAAAADGPLGASESLTTPPTRSIVPPAAAAVSSSSTPPLQPDLVKQTSSGTFSADGKISSNNSSFSSKGKKGSGSSIRHHHHGGHHPSVVDAGNRSIIAPQFGGVLHSSSSLNRSGSSERMKQQQRQQQQQQHQRVSAAGNSIGDAAGRWSPSAPPPLQHPVSFPSFGPMVRGDSADRSDDADNRRAYHEKEQQKEQQQQQQQQTAGAHYAIKIHPKQQYELRRTVVYSILPTHLKFRVFPPPRDIHDAKDRTLTEPISKLLTEMLYQQDIEAMERARRVNDGSSSRKKKQHRFHYEIVEDPASLEASLRRPAVAAATSATAGGAEFSQMSPTTSAAIKTYHFPAGSEESNTPTATRDLPSPNAATGVSPVKKLQRRDSIVLAPARKPSASPARSRSNSNSPSSASNASSQNSPAKGVFPAIAASASSSAPSQQQHWPPYVADMPSGGMESPPSMGREQSQSQSPPLPGIPNRSSNNGVARPPPPVRPQRAPVPITDRPAWGRPVSMHSTTPERNNSSRSTSNNISPSRVDATSVWGRARK